MPSLRHGRYVVILLLNCCHLIAADAGCPAGPGFFRDTRYMKLEEFVGLLGMYRLFCEVLRHSVPVFVKHQRPHGTGFHTLFLCAGQHRRLLPCVPGC